MRLLTVFVVACLAPMDDLGPDDQEHYLDMDTYEHFVGPSPEWYEGQGSVYVKGKSYKVDPDPLSTYELRQKFEETEMRLDLLIERLEDIHPVEVYLVTGETHGKRDSYRRR